MSGSLLGVDVMNIKLALVGDVMLGDHPVCFGHGVRSATRHSGISPLIEPCRDLLHAADVGIGNLECVLADHGAVDGDLESNEMRGRPTDAFGLAAAKLNVLSVANNHVMQHGVKAFDEMVAALKRAGIQPVGLATARGESNVVEITKGDHRVAVIAHSLRPERYVGPSDCRYSRANLDGIKAQVQELRSEFAAVVLCLHWGEEYLSRPSPAQFRIARELVGAGVTLIAGHHPHVIQGMERINESAVFYSLGNFIFDKWRRSECETLIAMVSINPTGEIESIGVEPLQINRHYHVIPVTGDAREARMRSWTDLCDGLSDAARIDESVYKAAAEKEYLRYRLASYGYFARNFHRYPPRVVLASVARSVRRRMGLA